MNIISTYQVINRFKYGYYRKLFFYLSHLSFCVSPTVAEPVTADIPEDGESHPGSEPSTPKGDQDLLTCGQCHSRFPLADILVFIEHKRRQCQGRLCMDKGSDLPPSPPPAGPRRACVPVEVAVQVSPHGEEHLASTPHGLRLKQENLTGRVPDVWVREIYERICKVETSNWKALTDNTFLLIAHGFTAFHFPSLVHFRKKSTGLYSRLK